MKTLEKTLEDLTPPWKLKPTGKFCDKHGDIKVEIVASCLGDEDCPECSSERIRKQDEEFARQAYEEMFYGRLKRGSMLSDSSTHNCSFDNFATENDEQTVNLSEARKVVCALRSGQVNNFWLVGGPGVGKSHLAMSTLKELNSGDLKYGCLFISFEEAIRRVRDTYKYSDTKFSVHQFVEMCSNADFLVIDDIGAEIGSISTAKKASDDVVKILYAISNARQLKGTIITSNLSRQQLEYIYDAKLISRLLKNHKIIKFERTKDQRAKAADF